MKRRKRGLVPAAIDLHPSRARGGAMGGRSLDLLVLAGTRAGQQSPPVGEDASALPAGCPPPLPFFSCATGGRGGESDRPSARHGLRRVALLALLVTFAALPASASDLTDPRPLERIALGSCARQDQPQPIWRAVAAARPQVFLFLGDNIYADTVDMEKMRRDYEKLGAIPEFSEFRSRVPILAMWDDHDYGANDAGAEYPKKEESKRLMLDFFDEPADSPRRGRPGVYLSKTFGAPGQRVQIILLDGRSFRSPLEPDPSPLYRYRPSTDPARTMLGEEQWAWLAEQLREPAEIRFIASGIQVLGYAHGFESWKNLPLEQERLFRVIREAGASGVVLLSGDAHFTQLKRGDGGVGYPLYELTSSSLTSGNFIAAARPAPLALYRPYGGRNFATIDIEWRDDPVVLLRSRDEEGNPVFEHRIPLSELEIWKDPQP